MDTYYIDGEFVDDSQACISVKDITVLRGFGVFDFLITYNRRTFHLQAHVKRLQNSARHIGLQMRHSADEICEIVQATLDRNGHHEESNIRMVYTGGVSSDGVTPEGNGILMVMVSPRVPCPKQWYKEGAKIITVNIERIMPGAKSTNYLSAIYALQQAQKADAVEAIYVDRNNRVLEGTTTNIFGFKHDRLITPQTGILPGVTRSVILELVKDHYAVATRDIDKAELGQLDECFISASNKEVVPIVQIDGLTLGNGKPGERTRHVMQLFKDHTTAYGQGRM